MFNFRSHTKKSKIEIYLVIFWKSQKFLEFQMAEIWIGVDLPYRPHPNGFATYSTWKYKDQPEVEIDDIFKKFKTLADIEKYIGELKIESPTACYFNIEENGVFYRDQQDCVLWAVNSKNQVCAIDMGIVANSIPEFLTRVKLESSIWHKTNGYDKTELTPREKKYILALEIKSKTSSTTK